MLSLVGIWLCLWNIIDFLTMGFNEGSWDISIIQSGLPSILIGSFIVVVCAILGFNIVLRGG